MTATAVHVVLDTDDSLDHQQLLHKLHSLEVGRVLCELRPDQRNLDWLAGDLLRSLGKRADLAGHGRNATRLWRRTKAWIIGEQITDLFISRAYLATPGQWRHLLDLSQETHCNLWLIVQRSHLPRHLADTLENVPACRLDFGAFEKRWRRRKTTQHADPTLVTPTSREELPLALASLRVPLVEFPLFRDACRQLLPPERFGPVDESYSEALLHTRRWLADNTPDETKAVSYLRKLAADAPNLDELLTRLRGAQEAFFLDWWLLKVDLEAFAAARDEDALSPLTPESVRLLRHYSSTTHAALALLVLAGRPPLAALAAANISAVAADGTTLTLHDREPITLPPYARGVLASHLAYRQLQGARGVDPLFASRQDGTGGKVLKHYKPNGLRQVLNKVAFDTGLALTVRGASWGGPDDISWRRRYGISVQPIARTA
jgi:hypothetical protein